MIPRNLLFGLALTASLLALGLAPGCGDEAPPVEPVVPVAPVADALSDPGQELTAVEQQQIKAQFSAEAAAEITEANAEAMADALDKEIEADLAAE